MDSLLERSLEKRLSDISPWRRRSILRLVKEMKQLGHLSDFDEGGLKPTTLAAVSFDISGTAILKIQKRILSHPVGRLIIAHELEHLKRGILPGNPILLSLFYPARVVLTGTRLREEALAFGEQYDFTREVYSIDDLPRLKLLYPSEPSASTIDLLRKFEILNVEEKTFSMDDCTVARVQKSQELTKAFENFMEAELNYIFIKMLEEALLKTREEFVHNSIASSAYQTATKMDTLVRRIVFFGLGVSLAYQVFR